MAGTSNGKTSTLFANARIFDGTGAPPFAGEVLVEGNRIAKLAKGGRLTAPPQARRIDCTGRTLMPGLVEPHGHMSFVDVTSRELTAIPVEEHMLMTVRNARTALDCGYTSVLSMAAAKPRLDVVLKREIEAGRVAGPRYVAASTELTVTGGLGDTNRLHLPYNPEPTFSTIVDGVDAMRRVCRTFAREGVEVLKLHLSGDLGGTGEALSDETPMTDAELAAAAEVGKASHLRLAAHARNADSVLLALRHGVRLINHANYADTRALDALEAQRDAVFVIPAAVLAYRRSVANDLSGPAAQRADAFKRELEATVGSVAAMRKRGIRVLPGGDYGFPDTPHGGYAFDLWLFTELFDYAPAEALAAATGTAAEIMGLDDALGVVREGALADLLVVDGDPLADIGILQDRERLSTIMKDGALHKSNGAAM